ncbi:MAG: hypothetical protein K6D02_02585 [Lachnospiraceae bacterium]|nr:hypothetical protein [Lachnospiraceae bacterium]
MDLEVLFLYFAGVFAGILCIIAIIINIIKIKKSSKLPTDGKDKLSIMVIIIPIFIIVLPVILLSTRIIRDKILISNSDLILVFESDGNGGIGDSDTFGYAIKGDSCKCFDLYIDYGLDKKLDDSFVEIKPNGDILETSTYKVVMENDKITVYNNNHEIYKYGYGNHGFEEGNYFNIDWEKCYSRK